MKKLIKYVKKYPFDATIWALITLGLLIAAYISYTVFLVDDMGVKYGSRLEGIEAIPVKTAKVISSIKANEKVSRVMVTVNGKIVNIQIFTKDKPTSIIVDELGALVLTALGQDIKDFYDVQVFIAPKTFATDKTSAIIGYVKAGTNTIAWTFNKGAYNE